MAEAYRWLRTLLQLPRHPHRTNPRLLRRPLPLRLKAGMVGPFIRGLQATPLKRKVTSLVLDESGNIGWIHAEKTHLDTIFFHDAVRSTAKNKQGNQAQAGDPE